MSARPTFVRCYADRDTHARIFTKYDLKMVLAGQFWSQNMHSKRSNIQWYEQTDISLPGISEILMGGLYRRLVYPNVAKAGGLQSPRKRDFRFAPTKRQGCNRLPRSLDNAGRRSRGRRGYEVLQLSRRVNKMRKTAPFLEFTIGDIQKIVETWLFSL